MPKIENNAPLSAEELELLLLTSRVAPDNAATARIGELVKGPIRWDRLLSVAEAHSVEGLAGANWLNIPRAGLPGKIAGDLQRRLQVGTMRGMFLSSQLVAILKGFAAIKIRALVFKGPALAMHAYQSFSARPFGDVDVLVPPVDASRAAGVLKGLGFEGWGVAPEHEAHHLRSECEETFVRVVGGARVACDLHWALSRGYLPLQIPFDALWQRSITVAVTGMSMWTLGCEDLLLYLCLHGAKHAWERLIWVCDIAELLQHEQRIDWKALFARATETGSARCLRLGLLLARDLLAAPLPDDIEQRVRQDPAVARLSESIREQFKRGKPAAPTGLRGHLSTILFHLKLRDRFRDQLRYLMLAALPNMRDREALPLPRQLFFLHYLSRPLRLLGRHGIRRA